MGDECETDLDCRLGLHCFYDDVPDANICGCSGFYGWEGENCTSYGPETKFSIFSGVLQVTLCLIGLTLSAMDIFRFFRTGSNIKKLKLMPKTVSWVYSTLGLTCFLGWRANEIVSAASPDRNTYLFQDESHFEKASDFIVTSRLLQAVVFVSTINGLLNISVMWLEVVYKSKRLILFNEKRMNRYKLVTKVSQFIFALLILFCAISGRYALLSTFAMPYLLIIIITYTIAKVKFTRMIDKLLITHSDADNNTPNKSHYAHMPRSYIESYKKIVQHVGTASSIIIVLLYLLIIGAVGFGLQDKLLPNYHFREFPIGLFCSEIVTYCNLFILLTLGWYTRQTYIFDNNVKPQKRSDLIIGNHDNSKTDEDWESTKEFKTAKQTPPTIKPEDAAHV